MNKINISDRVVKFERGLKLANGLLELAEFYSTHPELEIPYGVLNVFPKDKDELIKFAKAFRTFRKDYKSTYFSLKKDFGPMILDASVARDAVCEKVVTGHKTTVVEKPITFEKVEQTEEIIEWKCPEALLSQDEVNE